jgi:hypothetical protein
MAASVTNGQQWAITMARDNVGTFTIAQFIQGPGLFELLWNDRHFLWREIGNMRR